MLEAARSRRPEPIEKEPLVPEGWRLDRGGGAHSGSTRLRLYVCALRRREREGDLALPPC